MVGRETPLTDEAMRQLVEQAKAGQPEALDALLREHMQGLFAFVRARVGARLLAKESASDIVQSVCAEACQGLQRFEYESPSGFRHWLYTLAQHKIVERARFYGREKRDVAREARLPATVDEQDLLEYHRDFVTPSREASAREELQRAEQALLRLPETYREVVVLSRIVGLSHAEIAERMGRTRQAIWTLYSRALARLSTLLEEGLEEGSKEDLPGS